MVSGSLSVMEGSEDNKTRSSFSTYTEQFYEAFPYYLSIGMTYEQYWEGDPMLVKYYRKAEEMRNERRNQELWLQGMYIYEALIDVSPVLHAFARRGAKANPYSDRPYPITEKQRIRDAEERERLNALKAKRFMEALMVSNNAKYAGETHKDKEVE